MKTDFYRPKVLLLGSNGQVGFELYQALAAQTQLITTTSPRSASRFQSAPSLVVDLKDPDAIKRAVNEVRPQIVINAAAYTAVDKAETEEIDNWAINAVAPGIIGQAAAAVGASVISFSSDYVYRGLGSEPYAETETPNPQSAYGRAKLAGDRALAESGAGHLILRTSWVFGAYGQNFLSTMLRLGAEREQIKVVSDQVGSPTAARSLADFVSFLVKEAESPQFFNESGGTYHFSNAGYASWFEFADFIFKTASAAGYPLKLKELIPIPSSEYPTAATRPRNSRFSLAKLKDRFHWNPISWQDAVRATLMCGLRR